MESYFNKRREKGEKEFGFGFCVFFYRLWVLFVFIKKIEESSLTFVWYIWMMNFLFVSNIFDIKIRLILKRKRKLVVFSLVEYYFFKLLSLWFDHLISRFFCQLFYSTRLNNTVRKTGKIKLKQFFAQHSNYFIYIYSSNCKLKSWLLI